MDKILSARVDEAVIQQDIRKIMKNRHILKLLFIIFMALVSTSTYGGKNENRIKFAEGNTAFCFDLYQHLKKPDENLFFSPYSISTALAITYAGAKGQTEDEIAKTMHFDFDQESFFSEIQDVQSRLNSLPGDGYLQLSIANSLWTQKGNNYLESFKEVNHKYFDSELKNVDFINHANDAIFTINKWVKENTNGKINEILQPGSVTALTKIILCNVIYMKGAWANKFNGDDTKVSSFHLLSRKNVKVPMMEQTGDFRYKDFGSFRAIELPYLTGKKYNNYVSDLSMIIFLPESNRGLSKFENRLNKKNISLWIDELLDGDYFTVKVRLPKFTTTSEFELSEILTEMGMPGVFGNGADFSGIFGTKDFFINKIFHKAFIDINEEGTEAAAVTEEEYMLGGPDIKPRINKFYADHPFIFLILDNKSRSILFFGRVLDPSD